MENKQIGKTQGGANNSNGQNVGKLNGEASVRKSFGATRILCCHNIAADNNFILKSERYTGVR